MNISDKNARPIDTTYPGIRKTLHISFDHDHVMFLFVCCYTPSSRQFSTLSFAQILPMKKYGKLAILGKDLCKSHKSCGTCPTSTPANGDEIHSQLQS